MATKLRQFLVVSASGMILGLGSVYFAKANFGFDPLTTMMSGFSNQSGIELSIANALLNALFCVWVLFLKPKNLGFGTLAFLISSSLAIDIGMSYLPELSSYARPIGFAFGIILISAAIAIASKVNCGKNPYDALCFSLMEKLNLSYNIMRLIIDSILLGLGIVLGGAYGVGTIISVLMIGNVSLFFMKRIDNWPRFLSFVNEE